MLEIAAVAPTPSVPIVQGNDVVHAPLFETNVRLAGVGSLTVTPVAEDGPLLTTLMLNVTF